MLETVSTDTPRPCWSFLCLRGRTACRCGCRRIRRSAKSFWPMPCPLFRWNLIQMLAPLNRAITWSDLCRWSSQTYIRSTWVACWRRTWCSLYYFVWIALVSSCWAKEKDFKRSVRGLSLTSPDFHYACCPRTSTFGSRTFMRRGPFEPKTLVSY